jgi:acyl transferase domain-containing protein
MHHRTSSVKSSYLLEVDPRLFDVKFFSIKLVEAPVMDPNQGFLLRAVHEAIQSAGMPIEELSGTQTVSRTGRADVCQLRRPCALGRGLSPNVGM